MAISVQSDPQQLQMGLADVNGLIGFWIGVGLPLRRVVGSRGGRLQFFKQSAQERLIAGPAAY